MLRWCFESSLEDQEVCHKQQAQEIGDRRDLQQDILLQLSTPNCAAEVMLAGTWSLNVGLQEEQGTSPVPSSFKDDVSPGSCLSILAHPVGHLMLAY